MGRQNVRIPFERRRYIHTLATRHHSAQTRGGNMPPKLYDFVAAIDTTTQELFGSEPVLILAEHFSE